MEKWFNNSEDEYKIKNNNLRGYEHTSNNISETQGNKNLFWYGFFADVKKVIGGLLSLIGIICLLIGFYGNITGYIITGVLFIVLGFYLIATGSSQRFDYKRRSGHILHRGDSY